MARRSISIDEKINQQKQVVFQAKDKYDAAVAELEKLMKKRDEVRQKELLNAFAESVTVVIHWKMLCISNFCAEEVMFL